MTTAILVAAGSGTRMGAGVDKLFLEVAGRPVIAHTWQRFDAQSAIHEIVIVVREGQQKAFSELATRFKFKKPFTITAGGKERQDSVWKGLQAASPRCRLVAIHDAARPCVSAGLIQATIDNALRSGAATAAQRLTDTVKRSDDGLFISEHLDREKLWAMQTPQCFQIEVIRKALALLRERGIQVTDDTAACELMGQPVVLVESIFPNPKVTVPGDLPYIELLLNAST